MGQVADKVEGSLAGFLSELSEALVMATKAIILGVAIGISVWAILQ